MKRSFIIKFLTGAMLLVSIAGCSHKANQSRSNSLKAGFLNPPNVSRPGVYWYFMDGNMTAESMTADLESMRKAGIRNALFLEVNVGIPVGPVNFLSDEWQYLFKHAIREAERLGIEITLGIGPGWTGSGGPWVRAAQSMQNLESSSTFVKGGSRQVLRLPLPPPSKPFFGEGVFTPELRREWRVYFQDEAVLAFPAPLKDVRIADIAEKALYVRAPYSSAKGVKQFIPSQINFPAVPTESLVEKGKILDLTDKLKPDGSLDWVVPAGNWKVMRFVSRNNGAVTRPAPLTGLGFESDKFDTTALNAHLEKYVGTILNRIGPPDREKAGGLKRLHMDSWEMGAQNWTPHFRQEFIRRREYDPLPFYPVYAGLIVESPEISERFLWDLRQTSQELVLEYHASQVKKYAHRNGLGLSIEPYDMNPTSDLELGNIADMAMCEFWSQGYGFNSSFSCIEATSIAHINGQAVVPSEAFTAQDNEGWKQYPGSMKNQGDWAFATGINRFIYHTFQNQELPDSLRPGMTMGPYGVHWDRSQTWWPMVSGYHDYISRSQFILQQGRTVADVLYLAPEGSPHVFRPPSTALTADPFLPDRKGYNFDGCAPSQLYTAKVIKGQIVFPSGASYQLLVLPHVKTMTPALLEKIQALVFSGATVVGSPPVSSPGLTGYPGCDLLVKKKSVQLWGTLQSPGQQTQHLYGKGTVIWGGALEKAKDGLYPEYELTAAILKEAGVEPDFSTPVPVRYTHRTQKEREIYFVSNPSAGQLKTIASFRTIKGAPVLWDALTGKTRSLPEYAVQGEKTSVPLELGPYQSYFIVFEKAMEPEALPKANFPVFTMAAILNGPWNLNFDPEWGGPSSIRFDKLDDWTLRPEQGIKYYSGIATYHKVFDVPPKINMNETIFLDLGKVKDLARIRLNGNDLGVVWTAPFRVDVTGLLSRGKNKLDIEVANLWPNRLIGDEQYTDDGIKNSAWPEWLARKHHRPSRRYTFTTYRHYSKDSPLLPSGLKGPVTLLIAR